MRTRLFALILILSAGAYAEEGFAVIVSKTNPVSHISKSQLRRMLTGEMTTWPGGARVAVLLGPAGDPSRAAALKQVCGMSEVDFGKFTLQQSFGGDAKGVPKTL